MCHWLDRYLGACPCLLIFASSLPAWLMLILKLEAAGSSTMLVPIYQTAWWLFLPVITIHSITTSSCSAQMTITVCVSPLLLPSRYVFCTQKRFYLARSIVQIFPLLRLFVGLVGPTHFHPEDAAHSSKTSLQNPFKIVTKPHNRIKINSLYLQNIKTFTSLLGAQWNCRRPESPATAFCKTSNIGG